MKCVICKIGETRLGTATLTLERNGAAFVFRHVPAQICDNCGEQFVDETAATRLMESAKKGVASGVQVDVREYMTA